MEKSAKLSPDKIYRYSLSRIWEKELPVAVFIGLNPSTANEEEDDTTVRRCIGHTMNFQLPKMYGGNVIVNLFAFRATKPVDMKMASDPIGPDNDNFIKELINSKNTGIIIAMWGNDGVHLGRDIAVKKLTDNIYCLAKNKNGSPSHPLKRGLKYGIQPIQL